MKGKNCSFYVICSIILLIGLVIHTIVAGWVLSVTWSWFIVPLGLPAITVFQGLGIMTVVGIFLSGVYILIGRLSDKIDTGTETTDKNLITSIVINFIMPLVYLFILFMGWSYHLLMIAYPGF